MLEIEGGINIIERIFQISKKKEIIKTEGPK
jgi:hypothetical protein